MDAGLLRWADYRAGLLAPFAIDDSLRDVGSRQAELNRQAREREEALKREQQPPWVSPLEHLAQQNARLQAELSELRDAAPQQDRRSAEAPAHRRARRP